MKSTLPLREHGKDGTDLIAGLNLTPEQIAQIRAEMERYGVTQGAVARAAGVSKYMVSHVFARPPRSKSARVVATALRLIAEAKTRRSPQPHEKAG